MRSAPVVIKLEGGAIFHRREAMVPIGSEDLLCDFSNDPDQESIRGGAAEQSDVFQILSIAQAGKCSHDTVAPTVDRTRLGGSLEAIIYWRGTGSSNPSPSAAESVLNRLALRL
jgi:hypothetical protein